MKIRKAKKEDIKFLVEIYRRAYSRPKESENWSGDKARELLNFYFDQKTFIGFVAMMDKKVVGAFFSFIKPWHDGFRLGEGELFVDPKYQNNKIGSKLLFKMLKKAREMKCSVHELVAYDGIAKRYKKLGLRDSGLNHMEGDINTILKKIEGF